MLMILKHGARIFLSAIQRWAPPLLWMIMIFSVSADANSVVRSSRIIEPLCRWLMPRITVAQLEMAHLVVRKAAHMIEFAFLAFLLLRALSNGREGFRRWAPVAWVLATAFAASDEFHQVFVSNRNGTIQDVAIDSTGALLGVLACIFFTTKIAQPSSKKSIPALSPLPKAKSLPNIPDLRCILEGENPETRLRVRLVVDDRLLKEHQGCLILGRKRNLVQLCVKNTSISAQHMAILFRNGQFHVEDRNSSNGTLVNDKPLLPFEPVALANGDKIEVGDVLLYFRAFA